MQILHILHILYAGMYIYIYIYIFQTSNCLDMHKKIVIAI